MKFNASQLQNIRAVRRVGRRMGMTHQEILSAISTILVESSAQDLNYGDRDSSGAFQQRPSQGWGPAGEGVAKDAEQYFTHAKALRGRGLSVGQLAQAVQRSAFPDRYRQRLGDAREALREVGQNGRVSDSVLPGSVVPGQRPRLIPGGEKVDRRGALIAALTSDKGGSLLKRWQGEIATGAYTTTTKPRVVKGTGAKYVAQKAVVAKLGKQGAVGNFDGKPVLAKFIPELKWARAHGWTGTVTSGVRNKQQQLAAARGFGLQNYGPAGPLGSNHVEGHRGAVDVTNPDDLERVLRAYPGRRLLRRGLPNDPVHFSPTGR